MRKLCMLTLILVLCLPGAGVAETLTFQSEQLGLAFELPENWIQADDPAKFVFMDPEGNGAVVLAATDFLVTPELMEGITPEFVQEWIRNETGGDFTDMQQLLLAKTMDRDGRLYVISSCGCTSGGIPVIYGHYFFSATDGTLASLTNVSVNNEAGAVARNWFDQMLVNTLPEDILMEIAAQLQ